MPSFSIKFLLQVSQVHIHFNRYITLIENNEKVILFIYVGTGSIPTSRSSGATGGAQANNPANSTANMSAEMMSLDSLMIQPQQNSGASSNITTGGAASSAVSAAGRTAR